MKRTIYIFLWCVCLTSINSQLIAQQVWKPDTKVTETKTVLGQPTIVNIDEAIAWDLLHPYNGIIRNAEEEEDDDETIIPQNIVGNEGVKNYVQLQKPNQRTAGVTSPAPALTFEGWSLVSTYPPDIRGAAGLNHLMQVTNEGIKIFSKTGALLKTTTLKAFCPTAATSPLPPYDPHVVYDPNYNKYIFTCGGKLAATNRSGLFVAVSQTTDPTGNWYLFFVDGTGNTNDLFDYPLLGFNENWITISGNLFAGGSSFTGCKVVVIDRAAAYSGTATGAITIFNDNSLVTTIAPAATYDPGQKDQFLVENYTGNSGGQGYVKIGSIKGPVNAPIYSGFTPVGINQPWSNQWVQPPQKGSTVKLDMRDARIANAVYRNGSLWFAHHVFLPASTPTHSAVDWWQVDPNSLNVVQFSRIDPPGDTLFYFYPSMDVNAAGDVLLSFSQSSATTYPSASYAFHSHTDALGFTQDPYMFKAGVSHYIRFTGNRNRWGDYTGTCVDPVDQSFWALSEWAKAVGTWSSQIAHVIATPDTNCNAPVGLSATSITDTSVTLSWVKVTATATTFTLRYRKVGTGTWTTQTTANTTYSITGLTANTNYEWQVFNNCSSGSVSPYSTLSLFTTVGPCITIAGFTANPTLFCSAPATVTFTNTSTNANTYLWKFGDGTTGTSANISHTYNAFGDYTVRLIATGCTVDSITVPQYISVDSTIACIVSLPLTGTGPVQTGCNGQLYDSGGPGGIYQSNTDVSITISPVGAASVDVNFLSFNTEATYDFIWVYDGPNTASPLIGKFSGTTLPNGGSPITSSGSSITIRQTTDALQNFPGFALTWQCAVSNVPPVANFTSDATTSCNGLIQFTDQSTSGPTSWLWEFGDGQTSAFQNPEHTYTASGNYTVKLTSTNSHGSNALTKTNYLNISLPAAPTATNPAAVCAGNYVALSASGNPTLTWYDSPTGGSVLATGTNILTPPLYTTTTYYVASDQSSPEKKIGPLYTIGGGAGGFFPTTNGYYGLKFNCFVPVKLISVVMYASTTGPRRITLVQNGDTIQAITVNLTANSQTDTIITLNFDVPVGNNLELGCKGVNVWRNTAGANYPYSLPGILSITGNTASQATSYYYFYQWTIQEPSCTSARIPVTATIDQGPNNAWNFNLLSNTATFNNTTTGAVTYRWDFKDPASGSNNISTLQNPTHTFTSTGIYNVCLKATNASGCFNTLCQDVTVLTVGINEALSDDNISLYPNPVTGDLNILFNQAIAGSHWTLMITDVLGNIVAVKTIKDLDTSVKYVWDLSGIAKGAYIITLQNDDKKLLKKIIRQ